MFTRSTPFLEPTGHVAPLYASTFPPAHRCSLSFGHRLPAQQLPAGGERGAVSVRLPFPLDCAASARRYAAARGGDEHIGRRGGGDAESPANGAILRRRADRRE